MLFPTSKNLIVQKPAERLFIFGYGSLMYPKGVNCRWMTKRYENSDFHVATLKDFKRGLIAKSWNDFLYYGIKKEKGARTNGTIIEIFTDYDYTQLLLSEAAHPGLGRKRIYRVADVTKKVSCSITIPSAGKIMTFIPRFVSSEGRKPRRYVKEVWEGVSIFGATFRDEFLKSGGLKSV